jgi:hypothetical protein
LWKASDGNITCRLLFSTAHGCHAVLYDEPVAKAAAVLTSSCSSEKYLIAILKTSSWGDMSLRVDKMKDSISVVRQLAQIFPALL